MQNGAAVLAVQVPRRSGRSGGQRRLELRGGGVLPDMRRRRRRRDREDGTRTCSFVTKNLGILLISGISCDYLFTCKDNADLTV